MGKGRGPRPLISPIEVKATDAQVASRSGTKGKTVDLEDIKFHQCVKLNRFESDRTISFIPPDGAFLKADTLLLSWFFLRGGAAQLLAES